MAKIYGFINYVLHITISMTPFDPIRLQNIIPESMEIWVNGQWDRDGIILPTVKP